VTLSAPKEGPFNPPIYNCAPWVRRGQPSKTGKFLGEEIRVPTLTFPKRHKHADVRSREYLTDAEVTRLRKAARRMGRHGLRNDTMILLAYRHGLRVSELIALRWDQFDLDQGFVHVRRRKRGLPSTHPLTVAT
jgi:integrase